MKKFLAVTMTCAVLLAGLLACSGRAEEKQADLSAFAKSLQDKYEFASYLSELTPESEYFEEDVERNLPGLLALDLEQRVLLQTMININNGEIDLIQAKNAGDAARAAEIFQTRIDYMAGGGAFYPGPTELWLNHAQVVTHGNYVMLVVGEECSQIAADFNALFA